MTPLIVRPLGAVLLVVMMLVGGCGAATEGQSSGMGVEAALALQSPESLTVTGFVVIFENGEVILSDELTTSIPPEPEGVTVEVRGLDDDVPTWESADGIRWTTEPIRVTGTINDGVLTANATKSG